MKLESIEWTRVWREEVNSGKKRVLLIGDSIIDGSKSLIGKALGENASISAFITSKALDNPWYIKELALLLEQEGDYAAVYFNNGLHTGGLTPDEYASHYQKTVDFLLRALPDTPVLLGLSTPIAKPVTDLGTADAPITPHAVYTESNKTVQAFNRKVMLIGEKAGLPVFDAYSLMDAIDPSLRTPDGYHYTEKGSAIFADAAAEALLKIFKI